MRESTCGVWDDATTFERINDLKPGSFLTLNREWGVNPPAEINLTVPMPVRLREGFNGAVSIQRGPVIYALADRPGVEVVQRQGWICRLTTGRFSRRRPGITRLEIDREHPERAITFESRKPSGPLFTAAGRSACRPRSKADVCPAGSWRREPLLHLHQARSQARSRSRNCCSCLTGPPI